MRYVNDHIMAIPVKNARQELENVIVSNMDNMRYGEWTIKNVKLTTNGEFTCMAVNNNGRMMRRISGQFVIMTLTVLAAIMAEYN